MAVRPPPGGWRALGAFWGLVALALAGTAATLQVMGPPAMVAAPVQPPSATPPEPPVTPPTAAAPVATPPPPANAAAPVRPALPPAEAPVPVLPPAAETLVAPPSVTGTPPATATDAPPPVAAPTVAAPAPPAASPAAAIATAPPQAPAPAAIPPPTVAAAPPPTADPVASPPAAPDPPPLGQPRAVPQPDQPIPPPDAALTEAGRYGPLPRIGPDGRTPIRVYARAFDRADTRPRIGIVLGGIGLSAALSEEAIRRLPGAVALAFSPYAARPEPLLERARARGMEVLIALPLEPAGYPLSDPGDWALLTGLSVEQNVDRLNWVMSRVTGQVGAIGALGAMRGERFAAMPELLNTVQDHLRSRGMLYLDPRPGARFPDRAWGRTADLVIDEPPTRGEIDRRLAELEKLAKERGAALGLGADPTPVLVDRLTAWAAGLADRGLVLAPVTSMIRRPEGIPR